MLNGPVASGSPLSLRLLRRLWFSRSSVWSCTSASWFRDREYACSIWVTLVSRALTADSSLVSLLSKSCTSDRICWRLFLHPQHQGLHVRFGGESPQQGWDI